MNKQLYPTDLTDSQWEIIQELIPNAKSGAPRGHPPRSLEMRQVINAILYVTVGGIQWRMLSKEYPKWQSVYHYFRIWRKAGIWRRIHDTLRAMVRRKVGRHKDPSWVVERTFAWRNHHRRLSKDYEQLVDTSETFIYIVMIRLMLRRLACS